VHLRCNSSLIKKLLRCFISQKLLAAKKLLNKVCKYCVIDMRLNIFEHQSSVNPNMPLRDLDYVSRSFRRFYDRQDIYSERLIQLPNPRFVVFYNGVKEQPERKEFKLSDAYTH